MQVRDLFFKMIMELSLHYPHTIESLMRLVPHYGSFKDWFKLASLARHDNTDEKTKLAMEPIVNAIMDLAAEQLLRDKQALEEMEIMRESGSAKVGNNDNKTSISLLAKWAPREKKQFGNQVRFLANRLFPDSKAPKKEYRQLLSKLGHTFKLCLIDINKGFISL